MNVATTGDHAVPCGENVAVEAIFIVFVNKRKALWIPRVPHIRYSATCQICVLWLLCLFVGLSPFRLFDLWYRALLLAV